MKKLRYAAILTLLLALLVAGSALAQVTPVTYEDMASDYDAPGEEPASLVRNGDFNAWSHDSAWIADSGEECSNNEFNSPDYWCVWGEGKDGWEYVHLAQADLAIGSAEEKGTSYGMGLFIRHQGNGTGSFYAGAWQPLDQVTTAGYYFINISEAIWYTTGRGTAAYNSVAWYAISDTNNPWDSEDWRELDPYVVQCSSDYEFCNYAGRDETIWVEPGQYLHLIVAHKFPVFNASSLFLLDDVSLVPADSNTDSNPNATDPNGFYDWLNDAPADVKCHWFDEFCIGNPTTVYWSADAPR